MGIPPEKLQHLIQDGMLVKEGNGYRKTEKLRALDAAWRLIHIAEEQHLQKVGEISPERKSEVAKECGFETIEEVSTIIEELVHSMREKKSSSTGQ